MATAILRLPATMARTGLSRSTLHCLLSKNEFPKPIKLSERTVGWIESEIEDWLTARIEHSRTATAAKGR